MVTKKEKREEELMNKASKVKVVGKIDPANFDAANPYRTKALRKANKKKEEKTFQQAVDLAVNKLNERFDLQQIAAHFRSVLPYGRYKDVAKMSERAMWAALYKALEIHERNLQKKLSEEIRESREKRRDFTCTLGRALREAIAG